MQKNQPQQGGNPPSQTRNDQQSQSSGGRGQQGSNLKSDPGQAQSRSPQQGGDPGQRSDKQR